MFSLCYGPRDLWRFNKYMQSHSYCMLSKRRKTHDNRKNIAVNILSLIYFDCYILISASTGFQTQTWGLDNVSVFSVLPQEDPEREPRTSEETGLLHYQPPPSAPLRPGHQTHLGPDGSFRESPGQDSAVHRGQLQVICFIPRRSAVTQRSTPGFVAAEWWTVLLNYIFHVPSHSFFGSPCASTSCRFTDQSLGHEVIWWGPQKYDSTEEKSAPHLSNVVWRCTLFSDKTTMRKALQRQEEAFLSWLVNMTYSGSEEVK